MAGASRKVKKCLDLTSSFDIELNSNRMSTGSASSEELSEELTCALRSLGKETPQKRLRTSPRKRRSSPEKRSLVANSLVATKSGQQSLEKVIFRFEEVRSSLLKLKQAFASYKISSYFYPHAFQFCKLLGENLIKTEGNIDEMGQILEQFSGKSLPVVADETASPVKADEHFIEKIPKSDHPGSLTPPASEIGNDETLNDVDTSQLRKRKSESQSEERPAKRRGSHRNAKISKGTTSEPPPITNTSKDAAGHDENKHKVEVEESSDDDDNKTDEFEVESIKELVRKKSTFLYRVSWKGYGSDDDTQEPLENLTGCERMLVDFLSKRLNARLKARSISELKDLPIPCDNPSKELLHQAFLKIVLPPDPNSLADALKSSVKSAIVKTKEEILQLILKFLSIKDPESDKYKSLQSAIVRSIIFLDVKNTREKQLAELRAWERKINQICSDPSPLTVENNVDLSLPPKDFVYINDYLEGAGIKIPTDPMIGCQCSECHSGNRSCCPGLMDSHFAYNKLGRLKVSLATPIYECNKQCKCGSDCINRVVQNGRKIPLSIFRTENSRGWGVKALESIKKNCFVTEYVGEVISSEEAERRGLKYDAQGCTYLFDLDYNKGDLNPYTVDAAKYGNVSHFINHSCDPNLAVFNVWINCLDPDLPKLALFAVRDIKKGDELTFDYNSGSTRQNPHSQMLDASEGGSLENSPETKMLTPRKYNMDTFPSDMRRTPKTRNFGKTECRCGAANCRKFFF